MNDKPPKTDAEILDCCPLCGRPLEAICYIRTVWDLTRPIGSTGDLFVCRECSAFLTIRADLSISYLTEKEFQDLPFYSAFRLVNLRRSIRSGGFMIGPERPSV